MLSSGAACAKASKTAKSARHIPGVKVKSQQSTIYRCVGDVRLPVLYVNSDAGALAILSVGGKKLLFVNVQAASGVKYVADHYAWWSKDEGGFLEDMMQDEDAEPIFKDCQQIE